MAAVLTAGCAAVLGVAVGAGNGSDGFPRAVSGEGVHLVLRDAGAKSCSDEGADVFTDGGEAGLYGAVFFACCAELFTGVVGHDASMTSHMPIDNDQHWS